MNGPVRRRFGPSGESGQTTSEYLMIVGLLTAIILSLTRIIVPAMTFVVVRLAEHVAVYISSPG